MQLTPLTQSSIISFDDFEIQIQSQYEDTIPPNQRINLLEEFFSTQMGFTLDPEKENKSLPFIDSEYVEIYIDEINDEDKLVLLNKVMTSVRRFTERFCGLDVDEEWIDFNYLYGVYYVFVLNKTLYLKSFIQGYYDIRVKPMKKAEKELSNETDDDKPLTEEGKQDIGDNALMDRGASRSIQSYDDDYDEDTNAFARIISSDDTTLEFFLSMIDLNSPGDVVIEDLIVATNSHIISERTGNDFRNSLIRILLINPSSVEEILRK